MSDLRGGTAQDRTSFYGDGAPVVPLMRGPEDMPDTPAGDALGAGWRVGTDDWVGQSRQRLNDAYGPLVEAVSGETGKSINHYVWIGHSSAGINYERVWRDIAAVRGSKPDFLKDAGTDQGDFEKRVTERTRTRRAQDLASIERARGGAAAAALGGQFGAAMADPVNLSTLPFGGVGRTVAMRVLTEGLVNAGVEAIQQPMIAAERATRGEELSAGEAAANVALAGVIGSAAQGVIVEPLSALARKHLGWERMTEDERAAVNLIEREDEIDATSPFVPGEGSEAHAERLDATIAAILAEAPPVPAAGPTARARALAGTSLGSTPVPRETPAAGGNVSRGTAPRDQVKALIRQAESSGDDLAANSRSTAFGRYQFTAGTWLRYYRRRYGMQGLSEAQVLAKRADGDVQEQLMDDLTADNAAALARIGVPETPGSLYLMHFLGQGGGTAVLRAERAVPIERVVGEGVVTANPFLRGKTAGDVIEWADRKMGGQGFSGPVVRRDQFPENADGDRLWREAQAASEAADLELRALRAERDGVQAPEPEIALGRELDAAPVAMRDADGEPAGMDWEPVAVPVRAAPARTLPVRNRPSDVIEYLADRGGIRDDESHALRGGRDMGKVFVPRAGPLLRPGGFSIDEAGELLQEAGFFVDRPTTAEVLDMIERAVNGSERIYAIKDQADMAARAAKIQQADEAEAMTARLNDTFGDIFTREHDPELFDDVMVAVADGQDPWAALEHLTDVRRTNALARAAEEGQDSSYDWFDPENDVPFDWPADRSAAQGDDGREVEPGPAAGSRGAGDPDREAGEPPALSADTVKDFDDPGGAAAEAQIASIEHDLRAFADDQDAPNLSIRLAEEGDERSITDVLAEWDEDAAAIEAIRGCL